MNLPRYQSIARQILRAIASGKLPDGHRLPPERELAQQYGTSVGTLRKALQQLESQGRLVRIHGSGNYIRAQSQRDSVYSLFRLEPHSNRTDAATNKSPNAQLLSARTQRKPRSLPEFGQHESALRIRRVRYLGKTPVALEEIWLDATRGTLTPSQISDALYMDYADHLQWHVTDVEDQVSIATIPTWSPKVFPLASGTSCGFIERFTWGIDGEASISTTTQTPHLARLDADSALEYSRTWFDPNQVVYVQRFQ